MALDQRKRQRKLEKRKAKQKSQQRAVALRQPRDLSAQLRRTADAPFLHCVTIADLWREGIGHVLVSRKLPNQQVAFVNFLLDIYCLGVKNVIVDIAAKDRYEREMYGKLRREYELKRLSPECARKLVEGAVDYAADLGLSPHRDYRKGRVIFGDVDATACSREFEYGQDGKPLFIAGPHDGPARCQRIMETLTASCGPDGFHFIMPLGGPLSGTDMLPDPDDDLD